MAIARPSAKKILAVNVARLIKHNKQTIPQAARHIGMQPFQLKRILDGEQAVRLDTLQRIANGYALEPYQLLVTDLNPSSPQTLRALSPEEERVYQALEQWRRPTGT